MVETGGLENRYPADAGSGVRIPLPPPKLVAVEAAHLPTSIRSGLSTTMYAARSVSVRPNDFD